MKMTTTIGNCGICEERRSAFKQLNEEAGDDENARERIRQNYIDALREFECETSSCKELNKEGRNFILGSKGEEYDFNMNRWTAHSHVCNNCNSRYPESKRESYKGPYTDPSLEKESPYPFVEVEGEGIPVTNHYIAWVKAGKPTRKEEESEVVVA